MLTKPWAVILLKNSYSRLISITLVLVLITLSTSLICAIQLGANCTTVFPIIWSILALISLCFTYQSCCVGILCSTFCLLTIMRSDDVNELLTPAIPATIAFSIMAVLFLMVAIQNVNHFYETKDLPSHFPAKLTAFEWHLTFIRIYIGFNLIAHFGEKLFAGSAPFQTDVKAFIQLGVPHPEAFVILAGLCELAGAISVGLGFLTRVGAITTTVYLIIATTLGGHFLDGFIWANTGGGWEYPVFWSTLLLSFSVLGAGKYSIDASIKRHFKPPQWVHHLMG